MSDAGVSSYLFEEGAVVRHRNGTEYLIEATPRICRIEAGAVPAYAYKERMYRPGGRLWVRPQTEMEDGRFVLVDGGPYVRPVKPQG